MVANGVIPTPAEFDRVRVYLEFRAAQLQSACAGGGEFTFGVEPVVETAFGKAPAGAFGSERGLIDYALAFLNGDSEHLPQSDPRVMTDIDWLFGSTDTQQFDFRDRLTRFLTQLRSDRAAAQKWVTKQMPSGVSPLIRRERTANGGIGLRVHILLRTPAALVEFVIQLLADERRGFELRECKLPSCRKLFVKSLPAKGRGAPRQFCGKEHMKEAHDADAIKRAGRARARRAAEELLRAFRFTVRKEAVKQASKEYPEATAEQLADYARVRIQTARRHK
jgi:hypothetical protein